MEGMEMTEGWVGVAGEFEEDILRRWSFVTLIP
jgi:hypothetical protein